MCGLNDIKKSLCQDINEDLKEQEQSLPLPCLTIQTLGLELDSMMETVLVFQDSCHRCFKHGTMKVIQLPSQRVKTCCFRNMTLLKVAVLLSLLRVSLAFTVLNENITAEAGRNVTLHCVTNETKLPTVVEWTRTDLESHYVLLFRDGYYVTDFQYPLFMNRVELKNSKMVDRDLSLVLKNVTFKDSGTYECRVDYSNSNSRKKRSMLDTDPICIVTLKPGGTRTLPHFTVTTDQVEKKLERLHQRKALDPDGISARTLRTCANQLVPVLKHL
ncbi:uncharacterized protein KZ484_002771 [Pholidichthys leucotaenia]